MTTRPCILEVDLPTQGSVGSIPLRKWKTPKLKAYPKDLRVGHARHRGSTDSFRRMGMWGTFQLRNSPKKRKSAPLPTQWVLCVPLCVMMVALSLSGHIWGFRQHAGEISDSSSGWVLCGPWLGVSWPEARNCVCIATPEWWMIGVYIVIVLGCFGGALAGWWRVQVAGIAVCLCICGWLVFVLAHQVTS